MDQISRVITKYKGGKSYREFATALSKILEPHNMSISHQTISFWEKGRNKPDKATLNLIVIMTSDWRRDFALELLEILNNES